MIANISKSSIMTKNTLVIAGIDAKRVFTTICKPSFLLMKRNGLSALNALSAFKDFSDSVSCPDCEKVNPKSTNDAITMIKSSKFHPLKI